MARVSSAHLEARRQQILGAARRCFVHNGFHATSMLDILGEADLSSGALYRYFRSKEEIIIAIAEDVMSRIGELIADALPVDDALTPAEVLTRIFSTVEAEDNDLDIARLAVQVWGEAVRSPAVHRHVVAALGDVLGILVLRIRTYQQFGSFPSAVPSEDLARIVVAIMPGFMLQRAVLGTVDATMFGAAFTALLDTPQNGQNLPHFGEVPEQ